MKDMKIVLLAIENRFNKAVKVLANCLSDG